MELFRREALDGQDRLHGDIVFVPQISWRLLGAFFMAAFAAAALYLFTAQYRAATAVTGHLAEQDNSLIATFEVPAATAEAVVPGQPLRISTPGASGMLHARVGALIPSRNGATLTIRATLEGSSARPLRPGMAVRTMLATRSRTLAAWLYEDLAGRAAE